MGGFPLGSMYGMYIYPYLLDFFGCISKVYMAPLRPGKPGEND